MKRGVRQAWSHTFTLHLVVCNEKHIACIKGLRDVANQASRPSHCLEIGRTFILKPPWKLYYSSRPSSSRSRSSIVVVDKPNSRICKRLFASLSPFLSFRLSDPIFSIGVSSSKFQLYWPVGTFVILIPSFLWLLSSCETLPASSFVPGLIAAVLLSSVNWTTCLAVLYFASRLYPPFIGQSAIGSS